MSFVMSEALDVPAGALIDREIIIFLIDIDLDISGIYNKTDCLLLTVILNSDERSDTFVFSAVLIYLCLNI